MLTICSQSCTFDLPHLTFFRVYFFFFFSVIFSFPGLGFITRACWIQVIIKQKIFRLAFFFPFIFAYDTPQSFFSSFVEFLTISSFLGLYSWRAVKNPRSGYPRCLKPRRGRKTKKQLTTGRQPFPRQLKHRKWLLPR